MSLINLMNEWIYTTGFPLITIDNRELDTNKFLSNTSNNMLNSLMIKKKLLPIKQSLFLLYPKEAFQNVTFKSAKKLISLKQNQIKWKVPLFLNQNATSHNNQSKVVWMISENDTGNF